MDVCKNLANVKIAIIDHISSASAIQFPVRRIVEGLKAMQVLTLVDGAHAPGQIANLALDQLDADFYTGTVFENHRKSLIQHCERSELRLHFERKKVFKNAKNHPFWRLVENLKLLSKQCYQIGHF